MDEEIEMESAGTTVGLFTLLKAQRTLRLGTKLGSHARESLLPDLLGLQEQISR